jgi:hypothetical protein
MSKIGGKKKKAAPGAAAAEEPAAKKSGITGVEKVKVSEKIGSGFSEQDIEFMKKSLWCNFFVCFVHYFSERPVSYREIKHF